MSRRVPLPPIRPLRALSLAATACLLWAGPPAGAGPGETPSLAYRVTFAPASASLLVRVCARGFDPGPLVTDFDETLERLRLPKGIAFNAPPSGDGTTAAGDRRAYGISTPPSGDGCFEYGVDLAALAAGDPRDTLRVGADWITTPSRWLLRPVRRPEGLETTLALVCPGGFAASVPWEQLAAGEAAPGERRYRLDESAWNLEARVAFGRFRPDVLSVDGARIELAVLDAPRRASDEGIRRWIAEAARAVATIFGRFPLPRAQVVVQPVAGGHAPVLFGRSRQGGGGGVFLLLSHAAADTDLPGEWVAVHELAHLALPPVREEDAWFFEGVISYYQEVTRTRAGMRTEREGWQALHEGFLRGMRGGSERSLAEESADMHRHHAYHRVYWSGAALALRWDVTLRRTSAGRWSLDRAIRVVRDRPESGSRLRTAREVCEEMERRTGTPFCATTAERWLASPEFPAVDDLYAALGIRAGDDGRVAIRDDAPDAALRRAIMSPPAR